MPSATREGVACVSEVERPCFGSARTAVHNGDVEILIVAVLGLLTIAGAASLGPRVGIASPLLLVPLGIVVSFLPFVPAFEVEPELILSAILPPLLYSAAVSMPSMEFRREFGAISGLSVLLVVISAVLMGLLFAALIPGLGLAWGIALGAVVSPTDAVATSIVKRLGVSPRVTAMLEGESLLNDATALVLLRAAIAAGAAAVSIGGVAWQFVFSIVVASAIGWVVGHLNLRLRARVTDSTVNTVISIAVPFVASIPAELAGASGLVAAVVAGIVTGRHAPRMLGARHRLSDAQVWRTIELVLEGAVFLIMGLELFGIVTRVEESGGGVLRAAGIAVIGLLAVLVIRALFVAPLLASLSRRAARGAAIKDRVASVESRLSDPEAVGEFMERVRQQRRGKVGLLRLLRHPVAAVARRRFDRERFQTRLRRFGADVDYFLAAPLGWREGSIVVWAGMRGAVTLAAAQTLPLEAPERELLVLIAFFVAALSLLVQGGTVKAVVRLVKPASPDPADVEAERVRLKQLLIEVTTAARAEAPDDRSLAARLMILDAQRAALLDARDDGLFSAEVLDQLLTTLDADQLSLEMRADGPLGAPPRGPQEKAIANGTVPEAEPPKSEMDR